VAGGQASASKHNSCWSITRDRTCCLHTCALCRGLGEGVGAQDAAGLWLIGMPQDLQASVAEAAKDCGAAILQALPPDHWLIAATAGCVDTLLSFSSEVTAVSMTGCC
jgi:hypothetical protein